MKKHLLTLLAIGLCVWGIYFKESQKHHVVRTLAAPFVPVEAKRNLESAAFVSVDSTNFWGELESAFKKRLQTGAITNAPHADMLWPQVRHFVEAYSKGTFDAYLDFKSSGVPYEFAYDGRMFADIEASLTNNNQAIPHDGMPKAQAYWRAGTMANANGEGPRITDLSLERLTVREVEAPVMNNPMIRVAYADTGAPQHGSPSLVSLKETPEMARLKSGSILYSIVGLACKVDHQADFRKAHYLHVCLFWSDKYSQWLPLELLDDCSLKTVSPNLQGKAPPIFRFPDSFSYPVFF